MYINLSNLIPFTLRIVVSSFSFLLMQSYYIFLKHKLSNRKHVLSLRKKPLSFSSFCRIDNEIYVLTMRLHKKNGDYFAVSLGVLLSL